MIREFFLGQMDYVFFIYGLAFVLLSSVCIALYRENKAQYFWNWLGAFSLIHGINEWLDMLALSFGDTDCFKWIRIVILGVSFFCLFEFGRSLCEYLKYIKIGRWIYFPILFVIFLEIPNGILDVNATIRYSLGFIGGSLSTFGLWRLSKENKKNSLSMPLAACAMALYTLASGFLPPKSTVLLAGLINQDAFLNFFCFPVQILRAFAASGVGVMIWHFNEELLVEKSVHQQASFLKNSMSWTLLILVFILVLGWFFTDQWGRAESSVQRDQLLSDAEQALMVVDSKMVRDLSAQASDVEKPSYQVLKVRLQHLRSAMPLVRFIYLMRKVDGKIIFLVDSEQPGSKDESPPGQIYDEASPRLKDVFTIKKGVVDEPTTDRWGRWVSAYLPFNDARTGELIAVLGIDQNAHSFELGVAAGRLKGIVPLGIISFGVLFVFTYWRRFISALQQNQQCKKLDILVQWGMVVIVVVVGLTLTVILFLELRYNAENVFKTTFFQHAIIRVQNVSQELDRQIDRLDGLRRFMDSQEFVDRNVFSQYVSPLLNDVPVRAFEWIPRITKTDRIFYESSARQDGVDGFQIYEKDVSGKKIPALEREEYFPVYYVDPLKDNEDAPGYDLASDSTRRLAMEKSRDTGNPVATPPLELVQQGNKKTGLLLFMPVYMKDQPKRTIEQRRKSLKGFVLAVYSADDFLKGIYSKTPSEGLACLVEDLAAPNDRRILYRHKVLDTVVDWDRPLLKYVMPLELPDRQWRETIVPCSTFIERNFSRTYWWVLPFGFLLTSLTAIFLNFLMMSRYRSEILVKVRTDELKKEMERANAANAAKSQFLANMSHEIRTPMNAIIGFSNLLQETELNEVQAKYLESVKTSGELLLALINDILDVSKIEAGKIELESINFDLEYLVGDLVKLFYPKAREKNLDILFSFQPQMTRWFIGDPTRIRQIILNLVNNAIKFTESGFVEIHTYYAGRHKNVDGYETIMISVKDTGIGIEQKDIGKLFQSFSQVDDSITRRFGGTGLGLVISKAFAKKMHGDINVKSQVGKGSEFIVSMVLKKGDGQPGEGISMVDEAVLKGKVVVIVDDNQRSRQIVQTYCEQVGMKVAYTAGGDMELINRLSTDVEIPDIIISDIMMPGVSGMDLVRKLRAQERFSQVKILALTSDARPGTAKEAKYSGFDAYLSKPIFKRELIDVIRSVLGDKRLVKEIVTRHTAQEISLKGIRILVAEDVAANWELLKVYFDIYGCIAERVGNGQEAINKIQTNVYDVCLMDMQMPVMDGIQATQMIRRDLNNSIPIIALTAAVMKEDREKAFAAGVNDFLMKPLNPELLKTSILKWGKRRT